MLSTLLRESGSASRDEEGLQDMSYLPKALLPVALIP
jgi:hypothetical protein